MDFYKKAVDCSPGIIDAGALYYKTLHEMNTYTIKAKKDLINEVQCFTKDKEYTFETWNHISENSQLMNITVINDLGKPHRIDNWYKEFKILTNKKK